MNFEVVLTCAVTGAGDTTGKSPHVPVTPEEIANAAIEAATRAVAEMAAVNRHDATREIRAAIKEITK